MDNFTDSAYKNDLDTFIKKAESILSQEALNTTNQNQSSPVKSDEELVIQELMKRISERTQGSSK